MTIHKAPFRGKDGKVRYYIKAAGFETGPYTAEEVEAEMYAYLVRTA